MAPKHDPYARLAEYARQRWSGAGEVLACWSSQVGSQGSWRAKRGRGLGLAAHPALLAPCAPSLQASRGTTSSCNRPCPKLRCMRLQSLLHDCRFGMAQQRSCPT